MTEEYTPHPNKGQKKAGLDRKKSPLQDSKKDLPPEADGLDLLARLTKNGETLGDQDLHMKYTVAPADFLPLIQEAGTPEEILSRLPRAHPKKHLPLYYLILEWSGKVGGCISHTNKLRSEMANRGHPMKEDVFYHSLSVLEKAGLIIRNTKPLGTKKGSRRIIVPIGMAHRSAALLCSLSRKDTAAWLLSHFTGVSTTDIKKLIAAARNRFLLPRPKVFATLSPSGRSNLYPPTPQNGPLRRPKARRKRDRGPLPPAIRRLIFEYSGRNPFSEYEVLKACYYGWMRGASEELILLALLFFYTHDTKGRLTVRAWWPYYSTCAKNHVPGTPMWKRMKPHVASAYDIARTNSHKIDLVQNLIAVLESQSRLSSTWCISRLAHGTFEIRLYGGDCIHLKATRASLPKLVGVTMVLARYEKKESVKAFLLGEVEKRYQGVAR